MNRQISKYMCAENVRKALAGCLPRLRRIASANSGPLGAPGRTCALVNGQRCVVEWDGCAGGGLLSLASLILVGDMDQSTPHAVRTA
jgi:hypothetical protein